MLVFLIRNYIYIKRDKNPVIALIIFFNIPKGIALVLTYQMLPIEMP